LDSFYLDHFDNLSNHADAFEVSSRFDDNFGSEPIAKQILDDLSRQLVALAVSCLEDPAPAFDVSSVHHAVDRE